MSISNEAYVKWLIEAKHPKTNAVGWIREIDRVGTYDVYMTMDANKAIKFDSKSEAESIINDTGFQHAQGHINYYATEHMFNCGVTP